MVKSVSCPCDPNKLYSDCCQPYHKGISLPKTAEQLMRSRYSAYALDLVDYVNKTWHPLTSPNLLANAEPAVKWIKLVIKKSWSSQPNEAFVDFDAFYEANGKLERMHEVSRFLYLDGKWLYIDGKVS